MDRPARSRALDEQVTVLVAGDPAAANAIAAPDPNDINVLGQTVTGSETITRVLEDLPDVVVIDARIADPDIRAVCRRLRAWAPATKVLAVTDHDDEEAYTSVVAGAVGAVALDATPGEMAEAVQRVALGEAILRRRMARRLVTDLDEWARRSADPIFPPPSLTATEREVLHRLSEGDTADAIAQSHEVTAHLVNLHARFAVTKLHRFVLGSEQLASDQT